MIACIYVDVEHQAVDQVYDYSVPPTLRPVIEVGQRVKIPFGFRHITGVVVKLKETSKIKNLKPVEAIQDLTPVFLTEHLELAQALGYRYATPRIQYLNMMLPSAMRMTYTKQLIICDEKRIPKVLKDLFNKKGKAQLDETLQPHIQTVKKLIEHGVIIQRTVIKQKQTILRDTFVYLKEDKPVRGKKQASIIAALKDKALILKQDLLEQTQSSLQTLNSLKAQGIVDIVSKEKFREMASLYALKDKKVTLNKEQKAAVKAITNALNQTQTFLLHGVTSSGKTEVYMTVTETVLKKGKQVLILVPEISLTPLLTARFKARFGDTVAVYHSRLSMGEQYDEWRKVHEGKARVLIGARSAIFAPMGSIGLIILDEEHSDTYRQDDTPKYHAKEIAELRSQYHGAPLLLGSATPAVTSYYKAEKGDYTLLELPHRVLDSRLPEISIVDMKKEFLIGNKTFFSEKLHKAMQERIDKNEQTLLLINRRGHANFVLCRQCGQTINCEHCDVSMTYHHKKHHLKCHYCNAEKPMPKTCPHCGSEHIRYMGLGSERVEQALNTLFKDAKVYRMDKDTTSTKNAHESILHAFEEDGDFLVGTQMISKGLDFEKVTLVGVLSADMALYVPDYNAKEETFSLLTQMAGRSGRRAQKGEVIIQAYNADHPVLEDVKNYDYKRFYNKEIQFRKNTQIEPFKKLLSCTITHTYSNETLRKTTEIIKKLKHETDSDTRIIGPIKPRLFRLKDRYRMHILIKYTDDTKVLKVMNDIMSSIDFKHYQFYINHHPSLF